MESLEGRAIKAEIEKVSREIEEGKNRLVVLKQNLLDCNKRHFANKWGAEASEVFEKYTKLVNDCCYAGGEGYTVWVPKLYYYSHQVVDPSKYKDCQPTAMDRDAYLVIVGQPMQIPTKTHIERWGN